MSIAARRNFDANTLYWRVNQFILPFYTLVPPLSPFPDLSGHAWVPIDDENTLCIMFSYHPSQPLLPKTRQIFEEGHNGRESGHASRHSLVQHPVTVPYAGYWTKFNPQNGFQFGYKSQETTWFSGLPGIVGAGWRVPERRFADLRSHQGKSLLQRHRHRHDPPPAARDAGRLSRSWHPAEGRHRSRCIHGARGVPAVAARGPLGRRRRAIHACAAGRGFRVRAVTTADGLMQVRFKRISFEAESINSYELVAPAGGKLVSFSAGSHIDLHLPNGMIRSYSLVNDQGETHRYVIAVNNDAMSRGGSRFVHENLRAGDVLTISHPGTISSCRRTRCILIAGGIGITPLLSMIRRLEALGRSWEQVYAARTRVAAAFLDELQALRPASRNCPGRRIIMLIGIVKKNAIMMID
jgi:hypothetical protein